MSQQQSDYLSTALDFAELNQSSAFLNSGVMKHFLELPLPAAISCGLEWLDFNEPLQELLKIKRPLESSEQRLKILDYIAFEDRDRLRPLLLARLEGQSTPSCYTVRFLRSDGKKIPAQISVMLLACQESFLTFALVQVLKAENEAEEARFSKGFYALSLKKDLSNSALPTVKEIFTNERSKSSFAEALVIKTLNHELRNSRQSIEATLTYLKAFWQDLEHYFYAQPCKPGQTFGGLEYMELKSRFMPLVESLDLNNRHMYELLQGVLDFLQTNESPEFEEIDLCGLISAELQLCMSTIEQNTNKFYFTPSDKPIYLLCIPSYVHLIVRNLLLNACQALNSPQDSLGITVAEDGQKIVLQILDTGCGISPEDLPRLTQLFFSRQKNKENHGLGLFITDTLVRMQGGSLEFSSILGKGTTVTVTFYTPAASR